MPHDVLFRFEVHPSDQTSPDLYQWCAASLRPLRDVFRDVTYSETCCDHVVVDVSTPYDELTTRDGGFLSVPIGPKEFQFTFKRTLMDIPLPEAGTVVRLFIRDSAEVVTEYRLTFGAVFVRGDTLLIHAYEATPPTPLPEPCARCVKRDRRKAVRKRLRAAEKEYGRKFKTAEALDAYLDGMEASRD